MPAKKASKVLFKGKCPKCRQGEIFKYPLSNLHHFTNMNDTAQSVG